MRAMGAREGRSSQGYGTAVCSTTRHQIAQHQLQTFTIKVAHDTMNSHHCFILFCSTLILEPDLKCGSQAVQVANGMGGLQSRDDAL